MGITIINKPPIFDGKHTTHRNGDDWGMVYYCYTNIRNNMEKKNISGFRELDTRYQHQHPGIVIDLVSNESLTLILCHLWKLFLLQHDNNHPTLTLNEAGRKGTTQQHLHAMCFFRQDASRDP